MTTIDEGHLITAIAKRKNVADNNFLLIRNPEEIEEDIELTYTTILTTSSTEILSKYNVDYVYFSPKAKQKYNIQKNHPGKIKRARKHTRVND